MAVEALEHVGEKQVVVAGGDLGRVQRDDIGASGGGERRFGLGKGAMQRRGGQYGERERQPGKFWVHVVSFMDEWPVDSGRWVCGMSPLAEMLS